MKGYHKENVFISGGLFPEQTQKDQTQATIYLGEGVGLLLFCLFGGLFF